MGCFHLCAPPPHTEAVAKKPWHLGLCFPFCSGSDTHIYIYILYSEQFDPCPGCCRIVDPYVPWSSMDSHGHSERRTSFRLLSQVLFKKLNTTQLLRINPQSREPSQKVCYDRKPRLPLSNLYISELVPSNHHPINHQKCNSYTNYFVYSDLTAMANYLNHQPAPETRITTPTTISSLPNFYKHI